MLNFYIVARRPGRLHKVPTDWTKPSRDYTEPPNKYTKPPKILDKAQTIKQRLPIFDKSSVKYEFDIKQ